MEGAETLFPSGRPVVGKCPRCGADVTESKNGYFCERRSCKFGLWRDNRFLTGKTYDAFIVLEDDGTKSSYRLEFGK